MKKITIELTEDQMCRLKSYTKADNYFMGEPDYRTCEEMASFLVSLMTEPNQLPFSDDKKTMVVYNKEYKKLKTKNQTL